MTFVHLITCSFISVILSPPKRGTLSGEAETGGSWIPGLAVLARNDERVVVVIPAEAGIQGVWYGLGILFLSSGAKNPCESKEDRGQSFFVWFVETPRRGVSTLACYQAILWLQCAVV